MDECIYIESMFDWTSSFALVVLVLVGTSEVLRQQRRRERDLTKEGRIVRDLSRRFRRSNPSWVLWGKAVKSVHGFSCISENTSVLQVTPAALCLGEPRSLLRPTGIRVTKVRGSRCHSHRGLFISIIFDQVRAYIPYKQNHYAITRFSLKTA